MKPVLYKFITFSVVSSLLLGFFNWVWFPSVLLWIILGPILILGYADIFQKQRAIIRNFPIFGHLRYILESVRPEIQQYFVEDNINGRPISREMRSVVYQRSKNQLQTVPFGTQRDVYGVNYEWVDHSMVPQDVDHRDVRVLVGNQQCEKPYSASILNISAMSYGALSNRAVLALNAGAKRGGFAHNTGEGGISPYHLKEEGNLIWQIGTGYFGCRTLDGKFDPGLFKKNALRPSVKMVELKISQGAKPGHGGILPAAKVNQEIAKIRNVPLGQDVISPPGHAAFHTPIELLEFIQKLRELSGGKPVGFKLCIGKRREFISICKAMLETGIRPDFITVDGGEGGTGAAPLEFTNSIGMPMEDGLVFVKDMLMGFGLANDIKIIAVGKVFTAFHIICRIALGADLCYSARGFMLSLGCIQALSCHTNGCPTGITTNNPQLVRGLDVGLKSERVYRFHQATLVALAEMIGAMGISTTDDIKRRHINRRINRKDTMTYEDLYPSIHYGEFLAGEIPDKYHRYVHAADSSTFTRSIHVG